jgi:hypothetical protein
MEEFMHTRGSLSLAIGAVLLALALVFLAGCQSAQQPAQQPAGGPPQPTPAQLAIQKASQEDRQAMLDLLGIKALRDPVNARTPAGQPGAANYEESKANPYPKLPDPLILNNGQKVANAKMWWNQRRPELVEMFDREVYGRMPKGTPKVKWEVTKTETETKAGVPVITKTLVGHVDNSAYPQITVDIQMQLTTPAKAARPVPVLMEFGFIGPLPVRPGMPAMRVPPGTPWQEQVLAKGWGYAIVAPGSVQADNGAGLTQGIIGLVNKGQRRKPDDWGSLRAWGWGASRALDYLETDKSVDAKKIAIEGVSRYGKAAIVAMAYEPRIAMGFIGSSGQGGAKLHRRNWGELVENVTAVNEYHWMAGNYLKYAGPLTWNDLPVDSHELVAMCAPRPIFLSAGNSISPAVDIGNSDAWVDAKGTFLAGAGAGPVYKLLGKKDMGTTEFPPIDTGLMDGDLAFRQHSSGHTSVPNWPVFLKFAERHFGAGSSK